MTALRGRWLASVRGGEKLLAASRGPVAADLRRHLVPPGLTVRLDEDAAVVPLADGHLAARYHGDLLLESAATSAVGRIERTLDTFGAVAFHESLQLEAGLTGARLGTTALISAVDLYRRLGIREVRLDAADVGRYAWASAGFEFAAEQDRLDVLDEVKGMAARLKFELDRDHLRHPWHLGMLGPDVRVDDARDAESGPDTLSDLGAFASGTMMPLGKALMLSSDCPPWSGVLRFATQSPGSDRFDDYSQTL